MKGSKALKQSKGPSAIAVEIAQPQRRWWPYAAGILAALFVVFEVYWPAMYGPFLLDDTYLPYMLPNIVDASLREWMRGDRPLLMFSYWLNFQHAGAQDTFAYHMVNVVLHLCNGAFILLAVRKLLTWAGADRWHAMALSIFAAGLFLLHPLQTESVSYIASRSETLSVFFVLAAFVVFLYRSTDTIFAMRAAAILGLFALGVLTKEHVAVLPALFLLTDYYWNPSFSLAGIRKNWRLYVPMFVAGVLGVAFVWRVLGKASTAGFGMKDLTWYQYFFTQCRAIWHYLSLFLLPIGQNVDEDFPISHSVVEHGAIFGLIALVAVTGLAWIYRRRYPLASYGWLVFLILIAPTSSFVPIRDPIAERRMYLPFIGLLFITVALLRRWKTSKATLTTALSVVLIAEAALTYQRNQLWGSAIALWQDSSTKSPHKLRPRFQLAHSYFDAGLFDDSIAQYQKASELQRPSFELLLDWGLAYDGASKFDQAIDKFKQAATLEPGAHVYSQIGMEYAKEGKYPDALDMLAVAVKADPNFAMTYYNRGNVYLQVGNKVQAAEDYRHVLQLDPHNDAAREALARVGQ